MMDRIKGVKLSIYTENFDDLLRQYQDPEGWAITDAGLNEDEDGYYFSVEARGVGGVRQIALSITASALKGMLNALDMDYTPLDTFGSEVEFDLPAFEFISNAQGPFVNVASPINTSNTSCCADDCPCQTEV